MNKARDNGNINPEDLKYHIATFELMAATAEGATLQDVKDAMAAYDTGECQELIYIMSQAMVMMATDKSSMQKIKQGFLAMWEKRHKGNGGNHGSDRDSGEKR